MVKDSQWRRGSWLDSKSVAIQNLSSRDILVEYIDHLSTSEGPLITEILAGSNGRMAEWRSRKEARYHSDGAATHQLFEGDILAWAKRRLTCCLLEPSSQ